MKNRAAIAAGTFAAVLAVFVVLLATSETQRSGSVNFEILGEVAPQIAGTTLDGTTFDLYEHRGEWVVVNFFASWCVACRIEHPELIELTERHQGNGVELVSVVFADTEENARRFFDDMGGSWPTFVTDIDVEIDYGVTAVPETLLVSPSGRVVHKWVGGNGVTANQIDSVIADLEGGG